MQADTQLVKYEDPALSAIERDRTDMAINTLDFNCKEGQVIPIDDVDEEYITPYMLTEEESRLKETIWKSQNADYIKKQQEKKRKLKMEQKRRKMRQGDQISQPS